MGGGDLNMKKSWHPKTMKNQERLWKAEQQDTQEKKRIAELQREIAAERSKEDIKKYAEDSGVLKKKDDVKLEWMYKGPTQMVNNEDYLLGKAVDKNFDRMKQEEAAMASTSRGEDEQVDVARKLNEDPLMAIRKRAIEKAKQLYDNPVKMKQLRKMASVYAEMQSKSSKKHKKEKKKKKKRKKSKNANKSESEDSDEEQLLDALLAAKYKKLKNVLKDGDILSKLKKGASSEDSESDSEDSDQEGARSLKKTKVERDERNEHVEQWKQRDESPYQKHSDQRMRNHDNRNVGRKFNNLPLIPGHSKYDNERGRYEQRRSRSRSRDRMIQSRCNEESRGRRSPSPNRRRRTPSPSRRRKSPSLNRRRRSPSPSRKQKSPSSEKRRKYEDKRQENPRDSKTDARKRHNSMHDSEDKPKRSYSSSDEDRNNKPKRNQRNKDRSSSSSSEDERYRHDSDEDAPKRKKVFGLVMADGSRPVPNSRPVVKASKPAPAQPTAPQWQRKERPKLTEEEKEKRRQEMMNNALWRDKERETNVKRYRQEDAREKQEHEKDFDKDFLTKQLSRVTDQSSVEGRIKSKLNNIQRSKVAMDKNFARR